MVDVAHIQTQVVQRHAAAAVSFVVGNLGQVTRLVMHHQHLARHHLDLTHAHHPQRRIGDPWDDAQCLDVARGFPGQRSVFGWGVVNRNDGQVVVGLAFAQLAQDPVPVGLADLHIGLFASVPAPEQGLGGHSVGQ